MGHFIKEIEVLCDKCGKTILISLIENQIENSIEFRKEIIDRKKEMGWTVDVNLKDVCEECNEDNKDF